MFCFPWVTQYDSRENRPGHSIERIWKPPFSEMKDSLFFLIMNQNFSSSCFWIVFSCRIHSYKYCNNNNSKIHSTVSHYLVLADNSLLESVLLFWKSTVQSLQLYCALSNASECSYILILTLSYVSKFSLCIVKEINTDLLQVNLTFSCIIYTKINYS